MVKYLHIIRIGAPGWEEGENYFMKEAMILVISIRTLERKLKPLKSFKLSVYEFQKPPVPPPKQLESNSILKYRSFFIYYFFLIKEKIL